MIQIEPATIRNDHQHSEGERQDVVGVVRPGGDVEEEDQVHAHLGDRQHDQRHRDRRPPDQVRGRGAERGDGQDRREAQAEMVVARPSGRRSPRARRPARDPRGRRACRHSRAGRTPARSCGHSHQIDDREDADPDDVQGVPEQVEADQPVDDLPAGIPSPEPAPSWSQPQPANGDVQPVAARPGRRRRVRKPLRCGRVAARGQADELLQLQADEDEAEQAGDQPGRPASTADCGHWWRRRRGRR